MEWALLGVQWKLGNVLFLANVWADTRWETDAGKCRYTGLLDSQEANTRNIDTDSTDMHTEHWRPHCLAMYLFTTVGDILHEGMYKCIDAYMFVYMCVFLHQSMTYSTHAINIICVMPAFSKHSHISNSDSKLTTFQLYLFFSPTSALFFFFLCLP